MKITLTTALVVISQIVYGQTTVERFDSLFNYLHNNQLFNGNVLIAEKGKVIYKKSFGYANFETKERLNENSFFYLASITKQFTAMGIVMLKERGLLSYEDSLSKYIPELSFYKGITIKNLLHHTGGLPNYEDQLRCCFDTTKIATNADVIELLANKKEKLRFAPNTKFQYSNTGYILLASIIERVSGKTFADFLHENIFLPLKMTNTSVYGWSEIRKFTSGLARGYVYPPKLKKFVLPERIPVLKWVYWVSGIVGGSKVFSTTNDLLLWDRALNTEQLVSKQSLSEIFISGVLSDSSKTNYGFGWELESNKVYGDIISHTGAWPGVRTRIDRYINDDKTIIILTNAVTPSNLIPINEIRKLTYGIELPNYIQIKKKELKKFEGKYKDSKGNVRNIFINNKKLYRSVVNGNSLELKPISRNKFKLIGSSDDSFYEFIIRDGKVEKFILSTPETGIITEYVKAKPD